MSTYFIRAPMNDELYHFGIKGMKWGVRRNRQWNKNYSEAERALHRYHMGGFATKRINRYLNDGVSMKNAHRREANRISNIRNMAKWSGRIAGGVSLARDASRLYRGFKNPVINRAFNALPTGAKITTGGLATGLVLGKAALSKHAARGATMMLGGYSPFLYKKRKKDRP